MIFTQYIKHHNDIVYDIEFDTFESCAFFCGYAYNGDNIDCALDMLNDKDVYALIQKEIELDWQDAVELSDTDLIDDSMKHSLRIAMLIKLIKQDIKISPVSIDTFARSMSCLEGHHRLLALKHLGYTTFPAYLSGNIDELETCLNISMDDSH